MYSTVKIGIKFWAVLENPGNFENFGKFLRILEVSWGFWKILENCENSWNLG